MLLGLVALVCQVLCAGSRHRAVGLDDAAPLAFVGQFAQLDLASQTLTTLQDVQVFVPPRTDQGTFRNVVVGERAGVLIRDSPVTNHRPISRARGCLVYLPQVPSHTHAHPNIPSTSMLSSDSPLHGSPQCQQTGVGAS